MGALIEKWLEFFPGNLPFTLAIILACAVGALCGSYRGPCLVLALSAALLLVPRLLQLLRASGSTPQPMSLVMSAGYIMHSLGLAWLMWRLVERHTPGRNASNELSRTGDRWGL